MKCVFIKYAGHIHFIFGFADHYKIVRNLVDLHLPDLSTNINKRPSTAVCYKRVAHITQHYPMYIYIYIYIYVHIGLHGQYKVACSWHDNHITITAILICSRMATI